MGIMDRWIAQMLGNWDHCRRDGNRVTLTFEDTYAIFVMWALLVTASLAAFGFEKLRYAYGARKIRQQTEAWGLQMMQVLSEQQDFRLLRKALKNATAVKATRTPNAT